MTIPKRGVLICKHRRSINRYLGQGQQPALKLKLGLLLIGLGPTLARKWLGLWGDLERRAGKRRWGCRVVGRIPLD
jgi:hypothetical protein